MAAKKRKRVEESAVVKDRAVRFLFKVLSTADHTEARRPARARARGNRLRAGRGGPTRSRSGGVRARSHTHTTEAPRGRASEARPPPPPPPLRAARARSRALAGSTRRFSRRRRLAPPVSVPARASQAPRTSARARPVDDRETRHAVVPSAEGHSPSGAPREPPRRGRPRAPAAGAKRRARTRASGFSGERRSPRARARRVFPARSEPPEANASPPPPRRRRRKRVARRRLGWPRRASQLLAEAIPQ